MIIMGLDPGTAITGYGIIKATKDKGKINFKKIDYGCIRTAPDLIDGERLKKIESEIIFLVKKFSPDFLAIERIFFFKNSKTIIPVAQARGVILLAAAKKGITAFEFTPLTAKMVLTGYGRSDKTEIQKVVQKMLKLKEIPKPDDAADALGMALCCALKLKNSATS